MNKKLIHSAFLLSLALMVLPVCALSQGKDTLKATTPATLKGKWNGEVFIRGGWNFRKHTEKNDNSDLPHHELFGGGTLKYRKGEFSAVIKASGGQEMMTKDSRRTIVDLDDNKNMATKLRFRFSRNRDTKGDFSTEMNWKEKSQTSYKAFVSNNFLHSDVFTNVSVLDILDMDEYDYSANAKINDERIVNNKTLSYFLLTHKFGNGNALIFRTDASHIRNYRISKWFLYDQKDPYTYTLYRLRPGSRTENFTPSLSLKLSEPLGVKRMKWDFGTSVNLYHIRDKYCGERYVNDVWVDSTSLAEDFRYLTLTIRNYAGLDYTVKKFQFNVKYTLEHFADRLTDKDNKQKIKFDDHPVVLYEQNFSFKFNERNKVTLSSTHSIKRPSYKQICWYPREGDYDNQIIKGDPNLKHSVTNTTTLSYTHSHKYSYLTFNYRYTHNEREIEETFYVDTTTGRKITIFTWVNNRHSITHRVGMKTGYNNRKLSVNGEVLFFSYRQKNYSSEKKKEDIYWNFSFDASYKFNKDWKASVQYTFKSDRKIAYYRTNNYHGLNVKVEKKYKKHSFFLEGKGLLDKMTATRFDSEDGKHIWLEKGNLNRRYFILGYTYSF